jgi:hypothetical protein
MSRQRQKTFFVDSLFLDMHLTTLTQGCHVNTSHQTPVKSVGYTLRPVKGQIFVTGNFEWVSLNFESLPPRPYHTTHFESLPPRPYQTTHFLLSLSRTHTQRICHGRSSIGLNPHSNSHANSQPP